MLKQLDPASNKNYGKILHKVRPVSYTHLDVYKRQALHFVRDGKLHIGTQHGNSDVVLLLRFQRVLHQLRGNVRIAGNAGHRCV